MIDMIELFKIVNGIYDHACITHFDFVELSKDLIRLEVINIALLSL